MDDSKLHKLHEVEIEILDEIVRICEEHNLEYFLIGGTLLGAIRHKGFIPWDDDLDIAMPRESYEKFIDICNEELSHLYLVDSYEKNLEYWLPFIKIRKKGTVFDYDRIAHNNNIPKGIWVDIFPLDNVKFSEHVLQTFQAKLVKLLRIFIDIKQGFNQSKSMKVKFASKLIHPIKVSYLFHLQDKIMKLWNNHVTEYFVNLGSQYNYKKQTIEKDKYFPETKVEFEGKLYNAPNDYDYILKRIYGNYMELPPVEKRITHNPIRIEFRADDSKQNKI